jgi:sphingomyelin phosphodiesterase 4
MWIIKLLFFLLSVIDCWLRYDEESYELPSNEFIRLLRILVKQVHYFGNAADFDMTSLAILRQQSQPLLNARMYIFLKQIMSRWPMDSTFLNVLELWLSYIQPYRYTQNRNIHNLNQDLIDIPEKHKIFMSENLACYTQIFVKLIPRLLKMDMALSKNAFMLYRVLKVFRQPCDFLREYERILHNNSMRGHVSSKTFDNTALSPTSPRSPNRSNSGRVSPSPHSLNRHPSQTTIDDSFYVPMFSDQVTASIYELMQRVYVAKMKISHEVKVMEDQLQKNIGLWERFLQFIGQLSSLNFSFSQAMDEKRKTPAYLDFCLNILSPVFNIPIEEATREFAMSESYVEDSEDEHTVNSDILNVTPSFMKSQVSKISYTGDPELLPIMDHEIKWLVRFLYQVSCKLNDVFHNEINLLWNQDGFYGKFIKYFLNSPIETRIFDKSAGYSQLEVSHIGPRISLRKLASKYFIATLILSLVAGRMALGASSLGFTLFLFSYFIYFISKALTSSS